MKKLFGDKLQKDMHGSMHMLIARCFRDISSKKVPQRVPLDCFGGLGEILCHYLPRRYTRSLLRYYSRL